MVKLNKMNWTAVTQPFYILYIHRQYTYCRVQSSIRRLNNSPIQDYNHSINIRFLLITMFATLVFYLCKREQYKEYMVTNLLIMLRTLLNGN